MQLEKGVQLMKITIGQVLKDKRINLNLNCSEMAKKIGISRMTYYRIENDMTNHISFTTKSKIANVLNKNIEYVINLINLNKGE